MGGLGGHARGLCIRRAVVVWSFLCAAFAGQGCLRLAADDASPGDLHRPDARSLDAAAADSRSDVPRPPDAIADARADAPGPDAAADAGSDAAGPDKATTPETISLVQVNADDKCQGKTSSVKVTLNNPVSAHSTIIVAFNYEQPSSVSLVGVSDTLGNSYSILVGPAVWYFGGTDEATYVAAAYDVQGGADTVTVSLSGPSDCLEVYVHEFAGLAASAAFDVGKWSGGTSNAVDGMKSGFATTAAAHELIFGFGVTGQAIAGTGFTACSAFNANVTEYSIVNSVGSYQTTATMTSGSTWVMLMAAFRGQ